MMMWRRPSKLPSSVVELKRPPACMDDISFLLCDPSLHFGGLVTDRPTAADLIPSHRTGLYATVTMVV